MSPPKLLADRMLGKLARILRMIGQDTEYVREGDAGAIADRAAQEGRVLLTRDQRLTKRASVGPLVFVKSNYPFHQARQVIRELGLVLEPSFRHCVEDNGDLRAVDAASVVGDVPSYVLDHQKEFLRCDRCRRVFWPGTHMDGMRRLIASLEDAPLVGTLDEDDEISTDVRHLEPLVDLHQALEVLFVQHRVALMRGDLASAQRIFRRFAIWMRRHVQDETELVLPVYAKNPPSEGFPRGAAPEIFDHDHQKILEHLDLIEAAISDIKRAELSDEELRVRCLHQLDREKIFVDLCEHHDRRERLYLYPRLEQVLGDSAKADLLERMVGPGSLPEVRL
ncbi:MAG: Mut7-C RNAse domain-containing protein [Myxococcota bacterium]